MSLRLVEIPTRDIEIHPTQYFSNCSISGHKKKLPFIDSVQTEHYEEVIDDDNVSVHSGNYWRRAVNIEYQLMMEKKTQQDYCRGEDFYGACYMRNLGVGSKYCYPVTEANHYGYSPYQLKIGYTEEKSYYPYRGKETVSIIIHKMEDDKIHIQVESKYREDSVLAYRYQPKVKSSNSHKKSKKNNIDIITTLKDVNKPYNIIHDQIDGPWCCILKNHRRRFLIKKVINLIFLFCIILICCSQFYFLNIIFIYIF